MFFKEFLIHELKDNGSFQIVRTGIDSYTYNLYGFSKNKEIHVEKWYSWRSDNDVNELLSSVSTQLKLRLTDSNFIKQNLYLFNDEEYEHNTVGNFLDYVPGIGNQIENGLINTNNLVGYVNKKHNNTNYSIVISSRFGDNFLKHLIASTDGFLELPDSGDAGQTGMAEWLLTFLWKVKLKHAYRLGLPKEYVTKQEKTVSFRGNMNINGAIINPEFIPAYDCKFREHSYDNSITRLITNAFRLVRNKEILQDCHKMRQDFNIATEGKRIPINELLDYKAVKNPYYNDYNKVAELSQRIIKKEMADFSSEKDDFSAFFFDMSMLFEHFIRKALIRKGYVLEEKNKDQYSIPSGGVHNAGKWRLYPDIVIQNEDGSVDVFDVKYKQYNFIYGVDRDDLFQINTYVAHILNTRLVRRCGFIFPLEAEQIIGKVNPKIHELNIAEKKVAFEIHFFEVPNDSCESYSIEFMNKVDKFYNN